MPPSGIITSLCLLVRYLPRQQQGGQGGGEEGERRREEERRGKGRREKEGSEIQAQLNHLGCLLVGGVTTSLSAIWSATTRCLRMSHRVRLAALLGSFTAISKSRCVRIANGNSRPGRSIIQVLIRRIEQFLNSSIQFIDFMKLINSIRNLRIEAICDQFAINLRSICWLALY